MATLTPAQIRGLAAEHGIRPTKARGQNFMIDPNSVRRIVKIAAVDGEVVLEVGPGLGSLTLELLEHAAHVHAVELDAGLARALPSTVAAFAPDHRSALTAHHADALRIGADFAPTPSMLVSNLPYNVAVPVILHVLATFPSVTKGLVLVQAEVADRLVAAPGSRIYGVPSAKLAWYASARKAGQVARTAFWPVPNVDSTLVEFTRRDPPSGDRAQTFNVIDAAFSQRRKTLRTSLKHWAGSASRAEELLVAAGVLTSARGEALTIDEFAAVASARV